jgi:hypothetical protein
MQTVPGGKIRGVDNALQRLVRPSTRRFSEMIAEYDFRVDQEGIYRASQWLAPRFMRSLTVVGAHHVPASGPLVIAGNHPGASDILAYLAAIPRDDLHLVGGHPALFALKYAIKHIIYVRPKAVRQRGEVTAMVCDKLRDGQTVIIFPRGKMEPDPKWMEGSLESIDRWSRSVQHFADQVPGLQIVPAIVSGTISDDALRSPLVTHFRNHKTRQRNAMLYQLLRNAVQPHGLPVDVRLEFGPVLTKEDKGKWLMTAVRTESQVLAARARSADFPIVKGMRGWWYQSEQPSQET